MVKRFYQNFNGADGTSLYTYNAAWSSGNTFVTNQPTSNSVLYSNSLRRPNTQGTNSGNQKVEFWGTALTTGETPTPNDYEVGLGFTMFGTTTTGANVGVLARRTGTNNGYMARYRANTGYQLFRYTNAASTQLGSTAANDVNPSGVTNSNPLKRRIRLRVVGSTISVYVDTFDNTTSIWTVGSSPVITATDSTYTTGNGGMWFGSPGTESATPSDGFAINEWYTDDLTAGTPSITSPLTTSGTVGTAFSYTITGDNSPTSYGATGLPAGLSVNTSTGVISGTPTTAATSNITISATNAQGTGSATLVLTVVAPSPVITSPLTASGTVGTAFSYTITATNSPTSYAATGLPSGLSVNTSTGVISGTPTTAATSNINISAINGAGTGSATLVLTVGVAPIPAITSNSTATGRVGQAFTYTITATNSPTSYAATGLPAGLSLNTSTGVISGTPTGAAITPVTLTATNGNGTSPEFTLTITVSATATPDKPTSLAIKVFAPSRNDSPLNNAHHLYSDTLRDLVHLQWVAPAIIGDSAITGYVVQGSTNGSSWDDIVTLGVTTSAYRVAKPIGSYQFRVAAINSDGRGAYSDPLTVAENYSRVDGSMLQVNGVWTFFTHPCGVCYKGNTYLGWINNNGVVGVTKVNNVTKAVSSFELESLYPEIDDHDNAAIQILKDGRILALYGKHNDSAGLRYRVSLYPEDITAWSTAGVFSPANGSTVVLPTCYSNPRMVEDAGSILYHFRTGDPPNAPHAVAYFNTVGDLRANTGYSTGLPLIQSTQTPWDSQRPYVQSVINGRDRVDFVTTDGHPDDTGTQGNGNGTSVFHFYVKWDKTSKTFKYYKSDGTEITTGLPLRPKVSGGGSDMTVIHNGTTLRAWVWDIAIYQGNPWVLFVVFDNGSGSYGYTNHRYMFSRWNGSAWTTPVDIVGANTATTGSPVRGYPVAFPGISQQGVHGTTEQNRNYSGGLCFDSVDPRIVYASVPVLQTVAENPALSSNDAFPIREILEYRTSNLGSSWVKTRDITKNTPPQITNARPTSPLYHDGKVAVMWWRGSYAGWNKAFNPNIWGASREDAPINSDLAPIGSRLGITSDGRLVPYIF